MPANESSSVLVLISEWKSHSYIKNRLRFFLEKHRKAFYETDLARDHDSSNNSSYDSSSDGEPENDWFVIGIFWVVALGFGGFSQYKKSQQSGDRQIQAS